jgi:catechol 2,3-dioxygenase-like lactoylglutathione lyase family enzyme
MSAALNLVVIRSSDLQRAQRFYEALGLRFSWEQHGDGPRHLATDLGHLVFEIYPAGGGPGLSGVQLGFQVASVAEAIAAVEALGAVIVSRGKGRPWRKPAVVIDPDGNRLLLTEASSDQV